MRSLDVKKLQLPVIFSGNSYPVWARFAERKLKARGLWDYFKQGGSEGNEAEEDQTLMALFEMIDFKLAAKYGRADSGRKLWVVLKEEHDRANGETIYDVEARIHSLRPVQ